MTRTSGEIAEYLGAKLEGDAALRLSGIAGPAAAGAEDLVYLDAPRHHEAVTASRARCVVAPPGTRISGKTIIAAADPRFAFVKAAALLAPKRTGAAEVHLTAVIAPDAKIGANVSIGPYAVVEDGVEIGAGTSIGAFCFLGAGSRVAENCRLHPRVTLYAGTTIGNRVEIHSGCVLGADGFGYVFGEGRFWKFPQIGGLKIGDDVEIGANTTIDRGSLDTTEIAAGVKIDNLVQIAHNVKIGAHSVIAAQTGVSGSSTLGSRVIVGGQVGIADHCTLEDGAVAGAQAGIPTGKTIRGGETVWGTPARPLSKFKEQYAWFARLPELGKRLKDLEGKVR